MDVRKFSRKVSGVNLWTKVSIFRVFRTREHELPGIMIYETWMLAIAEKENFLFKILDRNHARKCSWGLNANSTTDIRIKIVENSQIAVFCVCFDGREKQQEEEKETKRIRIFYILSVHITTTERSYFFSQRISD